MDISENGRQIGEKLFVLLNGAQRNELIKYVLEQKKQPSPSAHSLSAVSAKWQLQTGSVLPLTEIQIGDLYFCLEERIVRVRGQEIPLTAREFDALHVLIANRRRVISFELLSDHIWGYDFEDGTKQAIHNVMSRVRQKLKVEPDVPDYITSVRGIGYKFNM